MISFSKIMQKVLTERMSFRDLYRSSTPDRVDRSKNVNARSLKVTTMDGKEAWTFTYKSDPSTTGHRWHGYVRFFKDNVHEAKSAADLECIVDCDCPDYRYRWAYNNAKNDAGAIGPDSWNQNNGRPPRSIEQGGVGDWGTGMCKHLIALGEFLKTNIEPDSPEPDDQPTTLTPQPKPKQTAPQVKPSISSKPSVSTTPKPQIAPTKSPPVRGLQTINAPEPKKKLAIDDPYSDSRSGDLQENTTQLSQKLSKLIQTKEFDVSYED